MRLLSYNILNGGIGRADPVAEVIEAQRPDVVVLIEADDAEVIDRIATRLDMDLIQAPGQKHAAAVLSRWPIVQSVNHALRWEDGPRSMLETIIQTPGGVELPILALHLHPRADAADEQIRLVELNRVLQVTEPWRKENRRHLLAGDFNSNAPTQRIDPAKCKKSTQESFARNGGKIPRDVVGRLLQAGYLDTLHQLSPTLAETTGSFTTHEPGQRVDYIFASGFDGAHLKSAWIEQDRLATFASDHYPVGVQIDV